jgi:dihydropteroate synthase
MRMTDESRSRVRDAFLASIKREPAIMGVLNVTPDSFSDGGRHAALESALQHAAAMARAGCAIIDVGGESTRPGAEPVAESEELLRIAPVVAAICAELDVPVSIDTYKAAVAQEASRLGAVLVNDVWGLQKDPMMAEVVAETGSAIVIMHNRASIEASIDIIDDMRGFFDASLSIAERAGIPINHIILDPGIGFGKTLEQNLACIWQIDRLAGYGLPILLGVSRKSFIGRILHNRVEERLVGTLAANIIGLMRGASIIRVHDVEEHHAALAILKAVRRRPNG